MAVQMAAQSNQLANDEEQDLCHIIVATPKDLNSVYKLSSTLLSQVTYSATVQS
jgi:hypothetical protein